MAVYYYFVGHISLAIFQFRVCVFSLARLVMEKTPHLLLAGAGANRFAKERGVPTVPPGSLVTKYARRALEEFKRRGGDDRTEIGHDVSVCR